MQRLNFRLIFLLLLLAASTARQVARENRPSFLRPGLRMYAYVANAGDGSVTVVNLVRLSPIATIPVGPGPSGLRAHPTRAEIWGVSSGGGYVWVMDAGSGNVLDRIAVGTGPFALDFSPDGRRAYTAASTAGVVVAIDCARRAIVARGRAGRRPWLVRVTPNGKMLVVPNHDDSSVSLLDAETLSLLATVTVAPRPEQVVILPDSSKAFVSAGQPDAQPAAAGSEARLRGMISVIDLERRVLLANLPLPGAANDLVLKPDGGELYVPTPESHGLAILNTWTNEVADYFLLGYAPARAVLTADAEMLYVSDAVAGQVTPIMTAWRRALKPVRIGERPGVCRLTPGEDLLLVVNEGSGNLAVIRARTHSLLTMVPVGSRPRDLAVKVF